MMSKDLWHYPRTRLAEQVLGMFEQGLLSALTFFAPRRMGKTEFLLKDIQPLANKKGWKTFYFSFLDVGLKANEEFTHALAVFADKKNVVTRSRRALRKVSKISGGAIGFKAGVELHKPKQVKNNIKEIVANLAARGTTLLLMDEVQILSQNKINENLVAGLRTALDIYKDSVKVVFTGSSREGLRRMFSQASAPFFHFGQNLPFPELDKEFTDHLAIVFKQATSRELDADILWETFQEMEKVPQLERSLVERLALNPNLSIEEAKKQLLSDVFDDRAFIEVWGNCSALEQLLLCEIAKNIHGLFSAETRAKLGEQLEIPNLSVPAIQSALRVLQRKQLVGRLPERREYFIDDPNYKSWLIQGHWCQKSK